MAEDGELSPWLSRESFAWTYSPADRLRSYRTGYSRRYLATTGLDLRVIYTAQYLRQTARWVCIKHVLCFGCRRRMPWYVRVRGHIISSRSCEWGYETFFPLPFLLFLSFPETFLAHKFVISRTSTLPKSTVPWRD